MSQKTFNSRVINKHDTEVNWKLATGFTPMMGELIIYDPDETHAYSRYKIGNGTDNVNNLPFLFAGQQIAEGQSFTYTDTDGVEQTVTAGSNAEIFNDYVNNIASGVYSHAEGQKAKAIGGGSHAEGLQTLATGNGSHAEGGLTKATNITAHAEGQNTTASGNSSHAEGYGSTASGQNSHAEGSVTTASNTAAHAEGFQTVASANSSHAEGVVTKASSAAQHVQGRYNIEDVSDTYAHIVGNGAKDVSSNAHTLDWNGNAWFAGDIYIGSTSGVNKDAGSKKLATEDYVTNVKNEILGTEELVGTYDTLKEIGHWIETSGVDATELSEAIAAEVRTRTEEDAKKLNKSGDTMTGTLTVNIISDSELSTPGVVVTSGETYTEISAENIYVDDYGNGNGTSVTPSGLRSYGGASSVVLDGTGESGTVVTLACDSNEGSGIGVLFFHGEEESFDSYTPHGAIYGLVNATVNDQAVPFGQMTEKFSTVPSLLGGTAIPANANLNDYKTVGSYYCSSNADVGTLTNCPTKMAFTMKMFYANGTSGYIGQEILDLIGARFFRYYEKYTNTWSAWKRYSTTDISGTIPITNGGTGATTAAGAVNNLGVYSIKSGTAITAGADLNTYKTVGNYYCSSDSTASGLSNCPIKGSFTMRVIYAWGTSGFIGQEVTNGANGVRFYRWCNVNIGAWSNWNKTITESDLSAIYGRIATLEAKVAALEG